MFSTDIYLRSLIERDERFAEIERSAFRPVDEERLLQRKRGYGFESSAESKTWEIVSCAVAAYVSGLSATAEVRCAVLSW